MEKVRPGKGRGEISLITVIQSLIGRRKVYAVEVKEEEKRIDIESTELYWQTLETATNFTVGVEKYADEKWDS